MNIEFERSLYEEVQTIESQISERIERNPGLVEAATSVVFTNNYKKRNFKQVLLQQHEIKKLMNEYKKRKILLSDIEEQKLELSIDKFDELYQGIKNEENLTINKNLNDFYKMKFNGSILSEFGQDLKISDFFNIQEYFGKYLDLIEFYEIWINLNNEKLNFIKYLEIFYDFDKQNIINENNEFLNYLTRLLKYLIKFINNSIPLFNLKNFLINLENEFNKTKEENPLYCKDCDKIFAKETVFKGHLTGKKHLKNVNSNSIGLKSKIELLKYKINKIVLNILNSKRQDTKLNNERKLILTEREKQIEINNYLKEENEQDLLSDEEETTNAKKSVNSKNPMNLPLGPDGKPIPFWLWKLNGLGIEFNCEICGDIKYKGRKAFEQHFFENKHIYGLKCLGIDVKYLKLFKDVVKIEEILKLWEKIKKNDEIKNIDKEESIQVEDSNGNVMSEKLYNELKKQGLI